MQESENLLEPLLDKAIAYSKTNIELMKLKAAEKVTEVVSTMSARLVVILIFSMFLIMVNIAIALWLGELTGELYYGFLIVGGFYGVSGIIFSLFFKGLKNSLSNQIISKLLN